jgi:hypothetical protein
MEGRCARTGRAVRESEAFLDAIVEHVLARVGASLGVIA